MTDTELLEGLFRQGWIVKRFAKCWCVIEPSAGIFIAEGETPRAALEDALLRLNADVTMPLRESAPSMNIEFRGPDGHVLTEQEIHQKVREIWDRFVRIDTPSETNPPPPDSC